MACDIFIRTYWKDAEWLEFCLRSITRYAHGFGSVIVVAPQKSYPWLKWVSGLSGNVRLELTINYHDDYLGQQITKLSADRFTDADFICHVDADCIFCRPTAPDDLISDRRPYIAMQSNASLDRHWPWQGPTEAFLGWSVSHDFMRRPPFTYPRFLYSELRAHAERVHGMPLDTYVATRPPRGFSEFNALGAFARAHHRDRFVWLDEGESGPGEPHCRWYWSWGGIDASTRIEIETLLSKAAS